MNADLNGVGHNDSSGRVGDSTITKYFVFVNEICLAASKEVIADSSFFLANSCFKLRFSYSFNELLRIVLLVELLAILVLTSFNCLFKASIFDFNVFISSESSFKYVSFCSNSVFVSDNCFLRFPMILVKLVTSASGEIKVLLSLKFLSSKAVFSTSFSDD